MKLLTAAQMRELDRKAIEDTGIPGVVLMENASRGLFKIIENEIGALEGLKALIICGKGNNGGDGFAVARHLHNAGAMPQVVIAAKRAGIKGDAETNMKICEKMKIPMTCFTDPKRMSGLRKMIRESDIIVDALLGTGVRGPVSPFFLKVVNLINRADVPVFAVDVPSGIQVDDGCVYNGAVNADHTVTFGAAKIGLFVHPAADHTGNVYVVDIGIPREYLDAESSAVNLTTAGYVRANLKKISESAHKGDCGKILLVGGSRGMSGSIVLAGSAALKAGVGLAYMAVPGCIGGVVDKKLVEGITLFQKEDAAGRIDKSAYESIIEKAADVDVVAIGPGMGTGALTSDLVLKLVENCRKPMLIDADGLNCLARDPEVLKTVKVPVLITPHPGEMARLLKTSIKKVQEKRLETAANFASEYGVHVILKGANSIIAAPDGNVMINPTGNSGMATAGSGDVLCGIAGAFLAEGTLVFPAAVCAAFVHGLAGDITRDKYGRRSVNASGIGKNVPFALLKIEEGEDYY
ncbi:MAG TPA: NAD(P)H-hydrate dehydratase [bacterium]|nr:NAD(P)H-hydrate dehydratase [bacterium]